MHYGAIQHVFLKMTYFIMKLGEYMHASTYLDLTLLWSFGVKIGPNDVIKPL
jgi:hypothetical protein